MDYAKMSVEELRILAGDRVKIKSEFKAHLTVYILVNAGLWLVYLFLAGKGGAVWPVYPMFGWGIGVVMHYLKLRAKLTSFEQGAIDKEITEMTQGR